jgi:hypothetical protein
MQLQSVRAGRAIASHARFDLPIELLVVPECEAGRALSDSIVRLYLACFPQWQEQNGLSRHWRDTVPDWLVVLRSNGKLIGHLAIIEREIRVRRRELIVAGIQGVCVHPNHRRRGLCGLMLEQAVSFSARRGLAVAALFSRPAIRPVYLKYAFRNVDHPLASAIPMKINRRLPRLPLTRRVLVDQDGRPDLLDTSRTSMMWRSLCLTRLPIGAIDLKGGIW